MLKFAKTSFPVCASFGPGMLAMASLYPNDVRLLRFLVFAVPGAILTSAALMILFRTVNERAEPDEK